MTCRDAQFYLRLRRESADELGDAAADLDRHLATCPDCAAEARAEASFDRALGTAMRAVAVPPALRGQLLAKLSATRGSMVRRKVVRSVALAASLFLTVGLAFGAFSASRPKLDTTILVQAADERYQSPEAATERWLAEQNLPPKLPLRFDFDELFLTHCKESVQGRDVPCVVFRDRNTAGGFAKVYLFRTRGPFDVKGVQGAQASHTQAVVKESDGVVYVIVFTGPRLDAFLRAGEMVSLR
jgi:hypothetical protein